MNFIEPPVAMDGSRATDLLDSPVRSWGPQKVPEASYLVLGDYRDNSRDSRFWGFVPDVDFVARGRVVYWSEDPQDRRIRWDRIGRLLE